MTPSVGRIVHYVSRGSADLIFPAVCRAAVITEVPADQNTGHEGNVMLCVLNPQGIFFDSVDYASDNYPGTWHWPERVE